MVVRFLSDVCISVAHCHLGLSVNQSNAVVNTVKPIIQLRGAEDSVVIRKLLHAMSQILVRHWTVAGIHAQTGGNGNVSHEVKSSGVDSHNTIVKTEHFSVLFRSY